MLGRVPSGRRRLAVVKDVVEIVAAIAVAASAVLALVQYERSLRETRVSRSLELATRFEDERLGAAAAKVDLLAHQARRQAYLNLDAATLKALGPTGAAQLKGQLVRAVVYGDVNESAAAGPPEALVEVIGYFNEVETCIAKGACDPDTAHAFLDEYAQALWADFRPIIDQERRTGRARFGLGLQRFVSGDR